MELKEYLEKAKTDRDPYLAKVNEWYNLIDMVDHNAVDGMESTVSNDPKGQRKQAIHILASGREKVSIAISEDEKEREKQSKTERAVTSLSHSLDDLQYDQGKMPWRVEAADFMFMTGEAHCLCPVVKDNDGNPLFIADNWPAWECYPQYGIDGLPRFAREYECSIDDAESQGRFYGWNTFDAPAKATTVHVLDYYELDYYGKKNSKLRVMHEIAVENQTVQKRDVVPIKDLKRIPIRSMVVNGYAGHPNKNKRLETRGESFLEVNSRTWIDNDRWMTYLLQATKMAIMGPVVVTTDRREIIVKREDLSNAASPIYHLKKGEDIRKIEFQSVPPGLEIIARHFDAEMQTGGLSRALTGMMPSSDISGYLYNSLRASSLAALGLQNDALNKLRSRVYMDWLTMFRDGGFKSIKSVYRSTGNPDRSDGYVMEDFTPKDVPDYFEIMVDKDLALPENMLQKANIFRQLIPGAVPAMSLRRAQSDILGLDDTDKEHRMIAVDQFEQSPPVRALEFIEAAFAQAEQYETSDPARANRLRAIGQQAMASFNGSEGQGVAPREGMPNQVISQAERTGTSDNEIRRMNGSPVAVTQQSGRGNVEQIKQSLGLGSIQRGGR
jgi:hypothetical protein